MLRFVAEIIMPSIIIVRIRRQFILLLEKRFMEEGGTANTILVEHLSARSAGLESVPRQCFSSESSEILKWARSALN